MKSAKGAGKEMVCAIEIPNNEDIKLRNLVSCHMYLHTLCIHVYAFGT